MLQLDPAGGDPIRVTVNTVEGRSENGVAKELREGLQAQAGKRYHVEVDDGEDEPVKKHEDFVITIVENGVRSVPFNLNAR